MQHGLFGDFDYDDWLSTYEDHEETFQGDEDNAYWRKRYLELCYELGEIINEQQDKIISLTNENRRLKRENWNLKKTKGKRK